MIKTEIPEFKIFNFEKCSKPCGGGVKHRKVHCRQRIALGDVADKPPEHCKSTDKPETERPCNKSPCSAINKHSVFFSGTKNKLFSKCQLR